MALPIAHEDDRAAVRRYIRLAILGAIERQLTPGLPVFHLANNEDGGKRRRCDQHSSPSELPGKLPPFRAGHRRIGIRSGRGGSFRTSNGTVVSAASVTKTIKRYPVRGIVTI
jgi:hypothetical protein